MSETDPLDISARDLMPNWLDELEEPAKNKYADYAGEDAAKDRKGRGKGRPPQGRGRESQGRGDGRERRGGRPPGGDRSRGKGPERGDREKGRGRGKWEKGGGRGRGRGRDDRRPAPPALEGVETTLLPDEAALESIAKYVKQTCRAYPMWDIARAMLGARERYRIRFRKSEGSKANLVRCKLDGSLWLSREEALRHVVRSDAIKRFYRIEEVKVDPPRGNFAAIAVHRKSGVVLGPPNHHEYRLNIAKLHRERFSHVPFDKFQRDIQMSREEEAIEAWKESKSVERHYIYRGGEQPEEEPAEDSETPKENEPPEENEPATGGDGEPVKGEQSEESKGEGEANAAEESVSTESPVEDEAPHPGPLPEGEGESPETEVDKESAEGESAVEGETEIEASGGVEGDEEPAGGEAATDEAEGSEEPSGESDETIDQPVGDGGESLDAATGQEEEAVEEAEKLVLTSEDAMAKHFLETHGAEVFQSVNRAVVGGDIPGRNIAGPLLSQLRSEVETKQRSPLTMIHELCRGLERRGVRFFKEGKKLFVASARPRALEEGTPVAEPVQKILDFLREKPVTNVQELMKALVPGFEPPAEGEDDSERKPSAEEMEVMRHLRWLASEGYVVEYSSGRVRLGGQVGEPAPKSGRGRAKGGKPQKGKEAKEEKEKAGEQSKEAADRDGETVKEESGEPAKGKDGQREGTKPEATVKVEEEKSPLEQPSPHAETPPAGAGNEPPAESVVEESPGAEELKVSGGEMEAADGSETSSGEEAEKGEAEVTPAPGEAKEESGTN